MSIINFYLLTYLNKEHLQKIRRLSQQIVISSCTSVGLACIQIRCSYVT